LPYFRAPSFGSYSTTQYIGSYPIPYFNKKKYISLSLSLFTRPENMHCSCRWRISRRTAEEVPENRILKIGFGLGYGTVPGPKDGEEVPLVEVDGGKKAMYCGVEIINVEDRAMGGRGVGA